jgi:RND family efflux transporter MFP subunit
LQALQDKAQIDVTRAERLRHSAAITQDEYEQHVAQLKVQTASIQSAKAAVRDAELNREFTKVTSPIDGRVSRARIREGNLVQPGFDESMVLTTVVTTDPVYACFNIDERALLRYIALAAGAGQELHPGVLNKLKIPVEIGLANEEGFRHAGILDFVDNKLDTKTGTIRARGVFDNAKGYLAPGLFVRVRMPYGKAHQALLVSERAIGTDQKQKYLLTVNKEKVVEYRRVKVGSLRSGLRVIEDGIQPDDWIVVKGLQRARPGTVVEPRTEKVAAASLSASQAGQSAEAGVVKKATVSTSGPSDAGRTN